MLAGIRDDIAAGASKRLRTPERRRPLPETKQCDMPGCPEPREPREPYCLAHLEALDHAAQT